MTCAFAFALLAAPPEFVRDVRPILAAKCFACHGPRKQKGGLRLDAHAAAVKGGDAGEPALVPMDSRRSLLFQRVSTTHAEQRMPPADSGLAALTPRELATLKEWIDAGADWPAAASAKLADPRDHWAYQPVVRPSVPNRPGAPHPVDAFLLQKLAAAGLSYSPEADRRTLIRRLSFDLLGLPTTPEEADAFVNDPDSKAYEKLVDRLLASPHYGERWASHWLDIAHYADTHGFERDQRRDHAWRYRDWVVKALNADLRYDDFLRLQIAGDALRPDDPDAVAATGFLAAGPWDFVGQAETPSPSLKRLARADDLDDMATQVFAAACATTINCARCHDHKLDPVPQREYYSVVAAFAGAKRADRVLDAAAERQRSAWTAELKTLDAALAKTTNPGLDLADLVGGGDGSGTGKQGGGIDYATGKPVHEFRGYLRTPANAFRPVASTFVEGVVVPGGGDVPIAPGVFARGLPQTTGDAWDAVRNGPLNAQQATAIGKVDYQAAGRSLLGLHANGGITFKLSAFRSALKAEALRFRADLGYGGRVGDGVKVLPRADVRVLVDGEPVFLAEGIGPQTGRLQVDAHLPADAKFLTLLATDGDHAISHDLVFFGDPRVRSATPTPPAPAEAAQRKRKAELEALLRATPEPAKVYAVVGQAPPAMRVHLRGNPEQPGAEVQPAALSLVSTIDPKLSPGSDGDRRKALAEWIAAPRNPLTRRVVVNRLWRHHFGAGIVETPSDFGKGGDTPSHPELLDWLADEFAARGWSQKALHRLLVTSAAYRQRSVPPDAAKAKAIDAGNRLLWRMNPRRLEAEAVRDAALAAAGVLDRTLGGPGFRDFDYTEAYAPIYKYVSADRPEFHRRSLYRFVVRTTPHPLMTTLDGANPACVTAVRNVTTTPLQALSMRNHGFLRGVSERFAATVRAEAGPDPAKQATRAFARALSRPPNPAETAAAAELAKAAGLPALCRALFNLNEFVHVD